VEPAEDLVLAIDQGTTATKCLLVDRHGRVVSAASATLPQHFPRPGWVEHDPEEIWGTVVEAVRAALDGCPGPGAADRIAAIGITDQRETSLVWRREDGAPIHRAIVWQDRRTAEACRALEDGGHGDRIREVTGLVTDPYFSGTKIAWTLDNVGGARAAAAAGELAAGTVDSFLVWRLTGGEVHATDVTNASRTMLWPLVGGGWSAELCGLLGVPGAALPRVLPCAGDYGVTRKVPCLPDGIPIRGVIGDQQAALFAQACLRPGEAKCTYGTGAFVMLNTGARLVRSTRGLLTTVAWQLGDQVTYCLEGSAFVAGALIQWLIEGLGLFEDANQAEEIAATVSDSGGVVVVPAHAGLGAPYWRPEARGLMCGLTRGTGRGHIARAALEGIANQVADLLEAMSLDTGVRLERLAVDGGASRNDLLMQIQADLLGVTLERPANRESTAMGAAFMAGLGAGIFEGPGFVRAVRETDRAFSPRAKPETVAAMREAWREAVDRA